MVAKRIVSFDTQDRWHDKLDQNTSMISKLTAHGSNQNSPFELKIYQGKREDKVEIIIINIDIKVGIDQTVVIRECCVEVELSMDKILEEGHSMIRIIEVNL